MIELERDEHVFVLRMRSGENRIGQSFLDAFHRALDEVEHAPEPRALVTTGRGRFYSNGLDIAGLQSGTAGTASRVLADLHALFARLLTFPAATVAAINGHAFAGGAMLSLAHDVRVMRADRGYFCLPEIDLATGQPLTPGMVALLCVRAPRQSVHEALITGRRYGGIEAAKAAFVDEVAGEAKVVARAIDLARARQHHDAATLGALKSGLYREALATLAVGSGDVAVGPL